jgi:hypothetical protein
MTIFHHLKGRGQTINTEEKYDNVAKEPYWVLVATDQQGNTSNMFLDYAALIMMQSQLNVAVLKHLGDVF